MNNNTTKINKSHNKNDNKAVTRIKNWSSYNAGMIVREHFRKLAKLAVSEIRKEMNSRTWKQHKTSGKHQTSGKHLGQATLDKFKKVCYNVIIGLVIRPGST